MAKRAMRRCLLFVARGRRERTGGGVVAFCRCVVGDVYLHNPRGSNNKLSEQQNNAQNQNRLFDSQNNAQGGYQIGDNCQNACQDENRDYDAAKSGAMKGHMTYYQGSELYIEWVVQHGCGLGQPNVICQMVLQYMCEKDNPGIRDGTKRGNENTAGGEQEPPTALEAAEESLGQHEPLDFYLQCKERERQKGLYTADQNVNNNRGATATRQNPNGNGNNDRNGLECPEERDYYPYWHPTPWHDIAIITDEPTRRCAYYQSESQNVKAKGSCSEAQHNHPEACIDAGAEWQETPAHDEPAPECVAGMSSRDNHNGNARGGRPNYYLWKIPDNVEGRCVLRLRYNITTGDFRPTSLAAGEGPATNQIDVGEDYFALDKALNDPNPGQRRRAPFKGGPPVLPQDPVGDWLDLGEDFQLQLQVNTNQYGRTFQDRSHTFVVSPRPAKVPSSARIVNYNVRGRRGNIVQVYPSVEYDFVPQDLTVSVGDFLHFQWTGSDANAKGNDGNGRQSTDRSNLVQVADSEETVPLPWLQHRLLLDASASPDEAKELVRRFAYLGQSPDLCDVEENNQNSIQNCKQLNGAPAYFDGGLVEMKTLGSHKVVSTRNNDFSNRSHKATILVVPRSWSWQEVLLLVSGLAAAMALLAYLSLAVYALKHPKSWLFSRRYRPRVLRYLVGQQRLQDQIQKRKEWKLQEQQRWKNLDGPGPNEPEEALADAEAPRSKPSRCYRCLLAIGLGEGQRLVMICLILLNVASFAWGFFLHLGLGFEATVAYPMAKGAGFALDLDLALLLLPTLKSLQTALRGKGGKAREWMPLDDPISFHIAVATLIAVNSCIHVGSHVIHIAHIAGSPVLQSDPLEAWRLSEEERLSGSSVVELLLSRSNFTGIFISALMCILYVTALPSVRRATCCLARRCGGFRLFQRAHSLWPVIYLLLLVHGNSRFVVWMFFPFLFVAVDRLLLWQRQRYPAVLSSARLLLFDVMHLTFEIPESFKYQAGQYVMLHWKGEWHPFTLTSAPEERRLTLHIRASPQLDWCSALRRHLLAEAPHAAAGGTDLAKEPAPGTEVCYERLQLPNGKVCCKAQPTARTTLKGTGSSQEVSFDLPRVEGAVDSGHSGRRSRVDSEDSEALMQTQKAPAGTVELQLQGPFGAPAQRVWEFRTVMVVGAGIGVTPFVSILRSVQMRMQQQLLFSAASRGDTEVAPNKGRPARAEASHAMAPPEKEKEALSASEDGPGGRRASLNLPVSEPKKKTSQAASAGVRSSREAASAATAGIVGLTEISPSVVGATLGATLEEPTMQAPPPRAQSKKKKEKEKAPVSSAKAGLGLQQSQGQDLVDQLVNDVIPVPRYIHFYWIVRNQQELDWFYDLLATAVEGPAKDRIEVNLFTTGEVELSAVKELKCVHHQYFGRPNWGRIFKGCKAQHSGEHVGVFLCGSPIIGEELSRQSLKHSDPPEHSNRTRFSFFKEHF
ncbi:DD3-3 [Symbiodinium sp. CCMP2456]|nr:DD3-3 [Symbiodinium sp. CCMP2456]